MTFVCKRCGYEANRKNHLIMHLRRKHPCSATQSSYTCEECLEELNTRDLNEKTYNCDHCHREFNTYQSRWRHLKVCKEIPKTDTILALESKVKHLEEMITELSAAKPTTINNITNNGQINNTQNVHIHLRDLGHENISYLNNAFLTQCFVTKDIVKLLENIHCDKEHPENHNIRIKSQKRNQIEMRENERWMIKDEDEALTDCIKNGYRILVRHGYKHKKDIISDELDNEEEYYDIRDWLERVHDSMKEQKPIKRKLLLLFLSNQALLLGKDDE